MAESFTKKEFNKKKLQKKRLKEEKRELKKTQNNKGKSFEEMIIYVDRNGHFTDVPPHLQVNEEEANKKKQYKGTVTHLNEKGFGFIKEDETKDSIFFSIQTCKDNLLINDTVTFTKTKTERGFKALEIHKES